METTLVQLLQTGRAKVLVRAAVSALVSQLSKWDLSPKKSSVAVAVAAGHPTSLHGATACSSALASQPVSRTSVLRLPNILQHGCEMSQQRQVRLNPAAVPACLILLVRCVMKAFSSLFVTSWLSVCLRDVPLCMYLACCSYKHRAACFSFPFCFVFFNSIKFTI